jgi:hypothetical protein
MLREYSQASSRKHRLAIESRPTLDRDWHHVLRYEFD